MSLRTLGGSIGLALYGTLFTSAVTSSIDSEPSAATGIANVSSLLREPDKIKALTPVLRDAVARAVTRGTGRVFLVAAPLALIGLLLGMSLPELPLRTSASAGQAPGD